MKLVIVAPRVRAMIPNRKHPRWHIEWLDYSGDKDYDIRETAASPEAAMQVVQRMLIGETWTHEEAEELGEDQTEAAYAVLVRDIFSGDAASGLLAVDAEGIIFHCDNGILTIQRKG
jgi:hypothetical protein